MNDASLVDLSIGQRLPLALLERLFDALPDVVFFAKDAEGRYTHANQTLLDRLRLAKRSQVVGRRADDLFPRGLGDRYREQDEAVLRGGAEIDGQLELHLYPNRAPGWCLTHKLAWREPAPGELYDWSQKAFARLDALIEREHLAVVVDRASMAAAIDTPSVVVASEGADFLEGRLDRVDEFHERWSLRHLQLTHYRVNALGDIQTLPPVHHGLTDFGRAVVRRCNERGIVVDVAHAPFETVRGVIDAASRPLVLSHTSLSPRPAALSRMISPDHARLVASTGGVIGVWPPAARFPSMAALARGIRDMVEVVGVDHVGLGSDMLGLTGPSIFPSYADLPALERALRDIGFHDDEVARIAGANYARVFDACMRA